MTCLNQTGTIPSFEFRAQFSLENRSIWTPYLKNALASACCSLRVAIARGMPCREKAKSICALEQSNNPVCGGSAPEYVTTQHASSAFGRLI